MPTYEYLCEANGRVVEVSHKMAEKVKTWGELCQRAEIAPGKTDVKTPVTNVDVSRLRQYRQQQRIRLRNAGVRYERVWQRPVWNAVNKWYACFLVPSL